MTYKTFGELTNILLSFLLAMTITHHDINKVIYINLAGYWVEYHNQILYRQTANPK